MTSTPSRWIMPDVICKGQKETAGDRSRSSTLEIVSSFMKARVLFLELTGLKVRAGMHDDELWGFERMFIFAIKGRLLVRSVTLAFFAVSV